ncbi:MAG TPA: phosphoribosylanthranilate isomerase [Polyangiaceae bacterium]|nr:phosphoribosylanthranilate isomerase [Polyangiaceae bacterium]
MTRIKICGVTSIEQAIGCVERGADAIGVNFVPSSPRCVDIPSAKAIALAVGSRALVVAVVADMTVEAMQLLRSETGAGCLQLHGNETPAAVSPLLPHAYKAIRVATAEDVEAAQTMPGDYVMVDANVAGTLGGTGRTFDWSLVTGLARRRRLVLAGGLTSGNVASAIAIVRPWCVDVSSGVESSAGVKDLAKVEDFVRSVRSAG